ncbi:leukocyte immunoglobulin-like receptor subfamily B member 1 [Loxodonta africana]|uniref:leukocyte immunoglobulin-like receptor subfamily B member 1 n=1 Tax=Loxodonta africana TaxID=9785 RepID=UPI0030CFB575
MASGENLTLSVPLMSVMTGLLRPMRSKVTSLSSWARSPRLCRLRPTSPWAVGTIFRASTDARVDKPSPKSGQTPVTPWSSWSQVRSPRKVHPSALTLHRPCRRTPRCDGHKRGRKTQGWEGESDRLRKNSNKLRLKSPQGELEVSRPSPSLFSLGEFPFTPSLREQPGPTAASGKNMTLWYQSLSCLEPFLHFKVGRANSPPLHLRTQHQAGVYQATFTMSPVTSAHGETYRCYGSQSAFSYLLSQPSDPLELVLSGSSKDHQLTSMESGHWVKDDECKDSSKFLAYSRCSLSGHHCVIHDITHAHGLQRYLNVLIRVSVAFIILLLFLFLFIRHLNKCSKYWTRQ